MHFLWGESGTFAHRSPSKRTALAASTVLPVPARFTGRAVRRGVCARDRPVSAHAAGGQQKRATRKTKHRINTAHDQFSGTAPPHPLPLPVRTFESWLLR